MKKKKSQKMAKSIGQEIIESLGEFTDALENDRQIQECFTCRTVLLDLDPMTYDAAAVKATRKILGASQAIFAQFLGVSVKAVHAWEQDANTPNGSACRFMDEIRRNPEYWRNRLRESVTTRELSR